MPPHPHEPAAARPLHTRAIIISSGDEIITGQLLDTNSQYLADALTSRGILPVEHITVPDDLPRLVGALRRACEQAPLVIISGGLGPTDGDLTREALAALTGDTLILDEHAKATIAALLTKRGREVSERQLRQAHRPTRATLLPNAVGTAPGLHIVVDNTQHTAHNTHSECRVQSAECRVSSDVFALPGPPGELRPMFETHVAPLLRPDPANAVTTRLLHVIGLPEAECVTRLGDLTRRDRNPLVGITASAGILTIRIRHQGAGSNAAALDAVDRTHGQISERLGLHVIPEINDARESGRFALAKATLNRLRVGKIPRSLATVESCTGGMLGEMLTAVPGSSAVYLGGHITYANELKEQLGVNPATLAKHGAVSPETAREMALAGLARTGAHFCLAITGIAGPDGGTPAKPVGTVHIGLAAHTEIRGDPSAAPKKPPTVHSRHFLFPGDRGEVRRRACISALSMLYFNTIKQAPGEPKLLWEVPAGA